MGLLLEPSSMAFGPGGSFGTDLFVANSSSPEGDIARVDPLGTVSIFLDDQATSSGLASCDLEFAFGGAFADASADCRAKT